MQTLGDVLLKTQVILCHVKEDTLQDILPTQLLASAELVLSIAGNVQVQVLENVILTVAKLDLCRYREQLIALCALKDVLNAVHLTLENV